MKILHECTEQEVKVFTVKEGYELGKNINSKVLAFALGLPAANEALFVSEPKEPLARKKN